MKELFAENWSYLSHSMCANAGPNCKRIDYTRQDEKRIRFVQHIYLAEGGPSDRCICRDFEPKPGYVWLYQHWTGFDDCFDREDLKRYVYLTVGGDTSIRYRVRWEDFANNDFLDENGDLKWVTKEYYRISRKSPIRYELIKERRE